MLERTCRRLPNQLIRSKLKQQVHVYGATLKNCVLCFLFAVYFNGPKRNHNEQITQEKGTPPPVHRPVKTLLLPCYLCMTASTSLLFSSGCLAICSLERALHHQVMTIIPEFLSSIEISRFGTADSSTIETQTLTTPGACASHRSLLFQRHSFVSDTLVQSTWILLYRDFPCQSYGMVVMLHVLNLI